MTAFMTYAIVMNALLFTGAGKGVLNRLAPTHAHFEWRTAYSPWFMVVRTTGFAMRGEDSAVVWTVTSDAASTRLGFFDFFGRRITLHDLRARGVTTHIRFKPNPPPQQPDTDEHYRLWTADIRDAVLDDVQSVSVDDIRVVASGGRVEGGLYFKPNRRVFIPLTKCRIENGYVFDGKLAIASELHGTFVVRLSELDPRFVGTHVLEHLDAGASGAANVGDLHFLDRWLRHEHIVSSGGRGPTHFNVLVDRGEIAPGSAAWVWSEGLVVSSNRDGFAGSVLVKAVVPEGKPRIAMTVETQELDIRRDGTTVVHAPLVALSVQFDNVDMTKPFDAWSASFDVPTATAHDLRALNAYLDDAMWYGGSATLNGHANITPRTISGQVKVDLSRAVMQVSKSFVTSTGTLEATLHDFDRHSKKGDLAGARIDLRDVSGANQRGWWVALSASPFSIGLKDGLSVSASVTGKAKNAQLPLAIIDAPGLVRMVFGAQGFTGAARVRISPSTTDLSDVRLIGNTIEVRAHYRDGSGAAFVETPTVNVGVLIRNGDTSTHLFVTRDWYTRTLGVGRI